MIWYGLAQQRGGRWVVVLVARDVTAGAWEQAQNNCAHVDGHADPRTVRFAVEYGMDAEDRRALAAYRAADRAWQQQIARVIA